MPRIAHSKRSRNLRNKRNRQILLDAWLKIKEQGLSIREIERLTGIGIGHTTLMLQGKTKMDQVTVMLIDTISRRPSTIREIELMWQGYDIDEITTMMVHES